MTFATLLFALIALPAGAERSSEPIMLDFTASWCGPCRSMKPAVEQLVQKGYPIKPVDLDSNPDLAEQYKVSGVPTFIVIDPANGRELARTSGAQPAAQLAALYRDAKAKLLAQRGDDAPTRDADEPRPDHDADADAEVEAKPDKVNPEPWETVVRIKVHNRGSIGFGSGTVIYSTPSESIILTCAHIFKLDGRQQASPSRFPLRISVDLFDGRLTGTRPSQVHYANETYEGEAIDYNFALDVGLLRIRPGRRLPYAKVVPPYWKPELGFGMITVGCSEGHDASAWRTTIVNPAMKGLNGNGSYEAIECMIAPKQGRSGGGLFTNNGYIAGVCDFAEPRGNHGLYAAPGSIYKVLDRNGLTWLYDPTAQDRMIASRDKGSRPRSAGSDRATLAANAAGATKPISDIRMQSPDPNAPGAVTLPPPDMLGIPSPAIADTGTDRRAPASKRQSWHQPTPSQTSTVDMTLDSSLDTDHFDRGASEPERAPSARDRRETAAEPVAPPSPPRSGTSRWKGARTPLPALAGARSN